MKKAFYTALTAISLVVAPTIAAAAPVAAPVTTPLTQPASETVGGDNALLGSNSSGNFVIAAFALVAIGLGIYVAVHNKRNTPNSP